MMMSIDDTRPLGRKIALSKEVIHEEEIQRYGGFVGSARDCRVDANFAECSGSWNRKGHVLAPDWMRLLTETREIHLPISSAANLQLWLQSTDSRCR